MNRCQTLLLCVWAGLLGCTDSEWVFLGRDAVAQDTDAVVDTGGLDVFEDRPGDVTPDMTPDLVMDVPRDVPSDTGCVDGSACGSAGFVATTAPV